VIPRQRHEYFALAVEERVRSDDEPLHARLGQRREGRLEIHIASDAHHDELLSAGVSNGLEGPGVRLVIPVVWVYQKREPNCVWHQFPQKLQPLCNQLVIEQADSGKVSSRTVEALRTSVRPDPGQ
jgi:hypothetical protein